MSGETVGTAGDPGSPREAESVDALRAIYEAKARAELADADRIVPGSDLVPSGGALFAETVLVKGLPGPAEATGGAALSGADGDAADRALDALGYDHARSFRVVSRVEPGLSAGQRCERLRRVIEAVDPDVVIALDEEAAEDLAGAFGCPPLGFGHSVMTCGRTLVAVDGLEASLADEARKRRVWRQLKSIKRPAPDTRR